MLGFDNLQILIANTDSRPGIKAFVTGKDIPDAMWGLRIADRRLLARNRVRFIGDAVATVAAKTLDAAEEALDLARDALQRVEGAL